MDVEAFITNLLAVKVAAPTQIDVLREFRFTVWDDGNVIKQPTRQYLNDLIFWNWRPCCRWIMSVAKMFEPWTVKEILEREG